MLAGIAGYLGYFCDCVTLCLCVHTCLGSGLIFVMFHHSYGMALSDSSSYSVGKVYIQWRTPWCSCELLAATAFLFHFCFLSQLIYSYSQRICESGQIHLKLCEVQGMDWKRDKQVKLR